MTRPHYPEVNLEPITTFQPEVLADHVFDPLRRMVATHDDRHASGGVHGRACHCGAAGVTFAISSRTSGWSVARSG